MTAAARQQRVADSIAAIKRPPAITAVPKAAPNLTPKVTSKVSPGVGAGAGISSVTNAPTNVATQQLLMPSFIDSTESVATKFFYRYKLRPQIARKDTSAAQLDGRVFAQIPMPGQPLLVRTQPRIELSVYRYAPPVPVVAPVEVIVAVPNVVRLSTTDAAGRLIARGLLLATSGSEYNDSIAAGLVARQRPAVPTNTSPGTTVFVWLSLGARPITPTRTMPPLVNRTLAIALDTLRARGLQASRVDTVEDATSVGLVVAQSPAEGTPLGAAAVITITVARAPLERRVPWVVGMTRETAERTLRDSGFQSKANVMPGPEGTAGRVFIQRPDTTQRLPPGRSVVIIVADLATVVESVPPRLMPSVVRGTLRAARDSVAPFTGNVRVDTQLTSDSAQSGRVMRQAPDAGEPVAAGERVLLTVGQWREPTGLVIVPDVRGRTIAVARNMLRTKSFRLGVVSVQTDANATVDSIVDSQFPLADARVLPNGEVSVVLRVAPPPPPYWRLVLALVAVVSIGGAAWYRWIRRIPPPIPTPPHASPHAPRHAPPPPLIVDVSLRVPVPPMPSIEFPDDRSVIETEVTITRDEPVITVDHATFLVVPPEE